MRAKPPAHRASAWIDPLPAVPDLLLCYDAVAFGWLRGQPSGALAIPHRTEAPPNVSAAKLRALARSMGAVEATEAQLRGRWTAKATAEPESEGGGFHLSMRRKLGKVWLDVYADGDSAAAQWRWGWEVLRWRNKTAVRRKLGTVAEGASWPDVCRVALREALAVDTAVCAADNATRSGQGLGTAEALELNEAPEPTRTAPVKAAPAAPGTRGPRRPAPVKAEQRGLF